MKAHKTGCDVGLIPEIEIPARFQPNEGTRGISEVFESCVGKVHDEAKNRDRTIHNRSIDENNPNEGSVGAGFRAFHQSPGKENIAARRKKEAKDSMTRFVMKTAQESLEQLLDDLNKRITQLGKQIEELEEEMSATEKSMEEKFGADWEEKLKRGELDKNDPLVVQYLLQQQKMDDLQRQREKLREQVRTLEEEYNNAETPEEKQAVLAKAENGTLWESRTVEDTQGSKASGISLEESTDPLQEKLEKGKTGSEQVLEAEFNAVGSSSFLAASLEGDSTYTKGIGEKGLSSQESFNRASHGNDVAKPTPADKPAIRHENNEAFSEKNTPTLSG